MVDEQNNEQQAELYVPARAMGPAIRDDQARVNVTWNGQQGELPDPVLYTATDGDVKQWVTEAVQAGVPGIDADPGADFTDFVVDRFPSREDVPFNRISVRPKTPFGD